MLNDGLLIIEQWPWIRELRSSVILYPLLSASHIFGIALLVGSIVIFDLRVLGLLQGPAWPGLRGVLLGPARVGFGLTFLSGFALFLVRGSHYIQNPAFLIKLSLLAAAMLNVLVFYCLLKRRGEGCPWLKVSAAVSLLVWPAVLVGGRLIAFILPIY